MFYSLRLLIPKVSSLMKMIEVEDRFLGLQFFRALTILYYGILD